MPLVLCAVVGGIPGSRNVCLARNIWLDQFGTIVDRFAKEPRTTHLVGAYINNLVRARGGNT